MNDAARYESQNHLERIDESYKNKKVDKRVTTAGEISMNNRRSKPYSANQSSNAKIVPTAGAKDKNTNAASTYYTSNNFATATNNGGQQLLLMNATMHSLAESGAKATCAQQSNINDVRDSSCSESRENTAVLAQQDRRPVTSNGMNEADLGNDQRSALLCNQAQTSLQPPRVSTTEGLGSSG